jgi:hypothetical protein
MEFRFASPELRGIDQLRLDALALTYFEDERPLRGLAGQVDWRLCGQLSRWIARGRLTGASGERALLPTVRRLGPERLLLHGLGPRDDFWHAGEARFRELIEEMLATLDGAGIRAAAVALPELPPGPRPVAGITGTEGSKARAMEIVVVASERHGAVLDEVVLLEGSEAQRAMQPVVEGARRRARASDVPL